MMNRFRKWLYKPKVSVAPVADHVPRVVLFFVHFPYPAGPSLVRQTSFPWLCESPPLWFLRCPFPGFCDFNRSCTWRALTILC